MRSSSVPSLFLVVLLLGAAALRAEAQAALEPLGQPLVHEGFVQVAAFSPDARIVMTLDSYGVCWLWDVATQQIIGGSIQGPHERTLVNFDRKGNTVVGPGSPFARVQAAGFTADGKSLVVVSSHLQRWTPATSKPQGPPMVMQGPVDEAYLSPNGKTVLITGPTKTAIAGRFMNHAPTARLISTTTGRQIGAVLKLGEFDPRESVSAAAFSPDSRTAYIVYPDEDVQRWDLTKGVRLKPDLKHSGNVEDMQFSSDGRYVLTINDDNARLWDTTTGSPVGKTFETGRNGAAALSPDGTKVTGFNFEGHLVVAAIGKKKALYKPKTDRQRHGRIEAVGFSPDSSRLVTVGKMAGVWNASTGRLIAEGGRHDSPRRVVFSAAGDMFLVLDGKRVYLWRMPA